MDRAATGFVAVLRGLVTTTPTEVVFLMDHAATGLFVALLIGLVMVMDGAATGFMRGTPVACERVDLDFVEEIKTESALAQIFMHQNIAKSYGITRTSESTYYVRELCGSSLKDFINYFATKSKELVTDIEALRFLRELKGNMSPCLMNKRHQPFPPVLQLLRDVVFDMTYLHEEGYLHRNLNPSSVLITTGKRLRAKISDFSVSQKLDGNIILYDNVTERYIGCNLVLRHQRQIRASDIFSMGCVFSFCLRDGQHPFGDGDDSERADNILKNKKCITSAPEVEDLISKLLHPNPEQRPYVEDILLHPMFNLEPGEKTSIVLKLATSLQQDNIYNNFGLVKDLRKAIRNKTAHHGDPQSRHLKGVLGTYPDSIFTYFDNRFPMLLIEIYKIVVRYWRFRPRFEKYFRLED
ncbi:non-specific serine/threonine protein kinase [Trifolium repens]|nr:non-specific serine/threonine protein kinase [Trifolium repens]